MHELLGCCYGDTGCLGDVGDDAPAPIKLPAITLEAEKPKPKKSGGKPRASDDPPVKAAGFANVSSTALLVGVAAGIGTIFLTKGSRRIRRRPGARRRRR